MQKDFHQKMVIPWTWIRKRSGILLLNVNHKENGDRVAELMMVKFGESGHPVFRAHESTVPRNAQKQKVVENYQCTSALMRELLKLFFRTIISVNQLSIYGAVSDLCDECKSCHVRTGRLVFDGTI